MSPHPPTFADLGAPAPIVESLARKGITEPFPIQAAVLPDALAGRDILGRAPTGSGKTIAFGIPLVAAMAEGRRRRPTALILSPTRELADQIADELRPLAHAMGHRVAAIYGGVGYKKQQEALNGGASLVVACPGRLEDLMQMGAVRLDSVDRVVIDEADRMADMGFLPAVRRIVDTTAAQRHMMLFSATLEGPVAKLTRDFQHDPARHEVGSAEPDMTLAQHLFWQVERTERPAEVARFAATVGSTIIFTRTRHGADRLAKQLAKFGVEAAPIHGGRNQSQRTRTLKAFGQGTVKALVATDVAARGIHVDDVAGVVHFDPPEDAATYVHRSGRTARAGATGVVLSLVDPAARKEALAMQKKLGLPVGVTHVDITAVARPDAGATARPATRPEPATRPVDGPAPAADDRRPRDRRDTAHAPNGVGPGRDRASSARPSRDRSSSARPSSARPSSDRPNHDRPTRDSGRVEQRPQAQGDGGYHGKVSSYSNRKGFGFITVKGRDDVFVHISGVDGEAAEVLTKGQRVTFDLASGKKGPMAVNVRVLSGS